jgi:hypothetical protein
VIRGVRRAGASTQAAVELAREGFSGGLWANVPLKRGTARELNLKAAYTWQAMEGLTLETSVTGYWFNAVPVGGTKHSLEAGVVATLTPLGGFTPSVGFAHDFRLRANLTQVKLVRSMALKKLGAFLDLGCFAGWATGDDWRPDASGARRQDGYRYWGAEAHLPYRIGPHTTLIGGVHYEDTAGLSATNGPISLSGGSNLWLTLGVSLDF